MPEKYVPKHRSAPPRRVRTGARNAVYYSGVAMVATGLSVSAGVSAKGGGRAESPLLDLVRTGIENDFERVVFPLYPELREVKRVLDGAGAAYASLSGSGSAVYGLFGSSAKAEAAVAKLGKSGTRAVLTRTLTRRQYWRAAGGEQ